MKELRGRAGTEVDAAPEQCFELLAAVERYPAWFAVVREVEIFDPERNGTPGMARAELHVPQSPFAKDFRLRVAVRTERPVAVRLTRMPEGPQDPDRLELMWRVGAEDRTWLEFEFAAAASFVPGFLPIGDAGNLIAQAVLKAAYDALTR